MRARLIETKDRRVFRNCLPVITRVHSYPRKDVCTDIRKGNGKTMTRWYGRNVIGYSKRSFEGLTADVYGA